MLKYSLGDMRSLDGPALRYEVEANNLAYAIKISKAVMTSPFYKILEKKLPSPRLMLYFQRIIRKEILPFVIQGYVIQWYKRTGKAIPCNEEAVVVPRHWIFEELKKHWEIEGVPIKSIGALGLCLTYRKLLPRLVESMLKRWFSATVQHIDRWKQKGSQPVIGYAGAMIACHYAEGIDFSKRNDISWLPKSGIIPERVLLYIDAESCGPLPNATKDVFRFLGWLTGRPTTKVIRNEVIRQVEEIGCNWVVLKRGIVEGCDRRRYWKPSPISRNMLIKGRTAKSGVDKWLVKTSNELLKQVYYWRSFHDAFNVRIHYVSEEGTFKNIAQAIAFDIDKKRAGVLVGKQRSEYTEFSTYDVGVQPKHIFFIWNTMVVEQMGSHSDSIEKLIISGYPYDTLRECVVGRAKELVNSLRSKGAKFIIALFDNAIGSYTPYSPDQVMRFYDVFLKWAIEDPELGLIIKSKKRHIIEELTPIHSLLIDALDTGRCVRLKDEYGRFPSEASIGANIAVGVGISTAVAEAVITGCRGIHYDPTRFRKHDYYRWGYGSIIFDDLETLVNALKIYKKDPASTPNLGDWFSHIKRLDYFHDGMGSRRMGFYMCALLEGFDNGKERDEAICYANRLYTKGWGGDTVIDMHQNNMDQTGKTGEYDEACFKKQNPY